MEKTSSSQDFSVRLNDGCRCLLQNLRYQFDSSFDSLYSRGKEVYKSLNLTEKNYKQEKELKISCLWNKEMTTDDRQALALNQAVSTVYGINRVISYEYSKKISARDSFRSAGINVRHTELGMSRLENLIDGVTVGENSQYDKLVSNASIDDDYDYTIFEDTDIDDGLKISSKLEDVVNDNYNLKLGSARVDSINGDITDMKSVHNTGKNIHKRVIFRGEDAASALYLTALQIITDGFIVINDKIVTSILSAYRLNFLGRERDERRLRQTSLDKTLSNVDDGVTLGDITPDKNNSIDIIDDNIDEKTQKKVELQRIHQVCKLANVDYRSLRKYLLNNPDKFSAIARLLQDFTDKTKTAKLDAKQADVYRKAYYQALCTGEIQFQFNGVLLNYDEYMTAKTAYTLQSIPYSQLSKADKQAYSRRIKGQKVENTVKAITPKLKAGNFTIDGTFDPVLKDTILQPKALDYYYNRYYQALADYENEKKYIFTYYAKGILSKRTAKEKFRILYNRYTAEKMTLKSGKHENMVYANTVK